MGLQCLEVGHTLMLLLLCTCGGGCDGCDGSCGGSCSGSPGAGWRLPVCVAAWASMAWLRSALVQFCWVSGAGRVESP